jgi:hypothetical protein
LHIHWGRKALGGLGVPFAAQAGADVSGLDGGASPVAPQELAEADALSVLRAALAPDDPADLAR